MAERADHEPQRGWEEGEDGHAHRHEDDQQGAEVREESTQSEHRPQVRDEAGGQDQLADLLAIEAGLDHHGIDNGHGCRAERDAGDQRRFRVPSEGPAGHREHTQEGQYE